MSSAAVRRATASAAALAAAEPHVAPLLRRRRRPRLTAGSAGLAARGRGRGRRLGRRGARARVLRAPGGRRLGGVGGVGVGVGGDPWRGGGRARGGGGSSACRASAASAATPVLPWGMGPARREPRMMTTGVRVPREAPVVEAALVCRQFSPINRRTSRGMRQGRLRG